MLVAQFTYSFRNVLCAPFPYAYRGAPHFLSPESHELAAVPQSRAYVAFAEESTFSRQFDAPHSPRCTCSTTRTPKLCSGKKYYIYTL